MSRRPLKIGLSARLMHTPPAELGFRTKKLQYIEQSIAQWVMTRGALALMVPTIETRSDVSRRDISVKAYVHELDGLVLQGGADVSPATYGEDPLRPEWSGDRVRDLYEMDLLWEFVIQGKPVLGVCRGEQLINVALGGSLWQDIATQVPEASPHVLPELYDAYHHDVEIAEGGWLASLYPEPRQGRVTSIHHQAVKKLGSDLDIEARSGADGIVEAIRWRGAGFLVGVQWHPEFHALDPTLLDSTPILEDFLSAAARARG